MIKFDNKKISYDIIQYLEEEFGSRDMDSEQQQETINRVIHYLEEHPELLMRYLKK